MLLSVPVIMPVIISIRCQIIIIIIAPPGSKDPGGQKRLNTSWEGHASSSGRTARKQIIVGVVLGLPKIHSHASVFVDILFVD